MPQEHIKILHKDDVINQFMEDNMEEEGAVKTIATALSQAPKELLLKLSRPFRNVASFNAYTTQEKLDWYLSKNKTVNNSGYIKLSDYLEAPTMKKELSKVFTSFASHKVIEGVIEHAEDYSNDSNIVPVPKPKSFFGK